MKGWEQRIYCASMGLFCIGAIVLAAMGLVSPYSYWYDELFSVTGAARPLGEMMQVYVLSDVHPPLYMLLLHVWTVLFGSSEIAVRALSELCVAGAFSVFASLCFRRFAVVAAISGCAVFATVWIFPYYAQEARSYGLMLLLATCLTAALLHYIQSGRGLVPALVGACLLSLVHYFGLVYAGLVLISLLYWAWPSRQALIAICLVGVFCLIWPAIHYSFGTLGVYSGGNFWIESAGVQTTLTTVALAFVPFLPAGASAIASPLTAQYVVAAVVVVVLLALLFFVRRSPECLTLLLIGIALIAVIAVIDTRTPISTHRNYIVLLPWFAFLVAYVVEHVPARPVYIGLLALCLVNFAGAAVKVYRKSYPLENWKALNQITSGPTYFLLANPKNRLIQGRIVNFYLATPSKAILPRDVANLGPGAFVVAGHKTDIAMRLAHDLSLTTQSPRERSPDLFVLRSRDVSKPSARSNQTTQTARAAAPY